MKKHLKYPFVEVRWWDAHTIDKWLTKDELPKPAPIITRGWLIKQTKRYVVIAGTIAPKFQGEPTQFGEVITVPRCWAKIKRLR